MRALLELLLLAWMALGFFAWLLRDGLGPDSTESEGFEAVGRMFWTFWWGPSGLLLAGLWLLATKRGAQPRDAANRENA